jgi:hypothetical protein
MAELDVEITAVMIATVLSFVAGYLLSLLAERKRRTDVVNGAARSLIIELREIQTALSGHVRTNEQVQGTIAEFKTGHINAVIFALPTAAYDSALYSGAFKEFDKETQVRIAAVYNDVKFANTLELKFLETTTSVSSEVTTAFVQSLGMFYTMKNNVERELQTSVGNLITLLETKFRIEGH